MSKSKPFSTRLSYDSPEENSVIDYLDTFEEEVYKPSHYIRDAVLLRRRLELYFSDQQVEMLPGGEGVEQIYDLVKQPDPPEPIPPAAEQGPIRWSPGEHEIDQQLGGMFKDWSPSQIENWIQEAARMRFLIEDNAPSFFLAKHEAAKQSAVSSVVRSFEVEVVDGIRLDAPVADPPQPEQSGIQELANAIESFMNLPEPTFVLEVG